MTLQKAQVLRNTYAEVLASQSKKEAFRGIQRTMKLTRKIQQTTIYTSRRCDERKAQVKHLRAFFKCRWWLLARKIKRRRKFRAAFSSLVPRSRVRGKARRNGKTRRAWFENFVFFSTHICMCPDWKPLNCFGCAQLWAFWNIDKV